MCNAIFAEFDSVYKCWNTESRVLWMCQLFNILLLNCCFFLLNNCECVDIINMFIVFGCACGSVVVRHREYLLGTLRYWVHTSTHVCLSLSDFSIKASLSTICVLLSEISASVEFSAVYIFILTFFISLLTFLSWVIIVLLRYRHVVFFLYLLRHRCSSCQLCVCVKFFVFIANRPLSLADWSATC